MEVKRMEKEQIFGLNMWTPKEPEDSLSGTVTSIDNDAQYGIQVAVKNADGVTLLTPSHKWLQNCLKQIKVGDTIQIVFKRDEPPKVKGQSPTKVYEVFRIK
jgi:hypothetical protein